jgi:hypothetical protein
MTTEAPMPDLVDELQHAAAQAIAAMRVAALEARRLHANAELMRHMRGTAAKLVARPLDEAAALVAGEWMKAWHLDGDAYAALGPDVARFCLAFCRDARGATPATQADIREAIGALEAALGQHGTSIADQMAWRSECAHGWWELVVPTPDDLPARSDRPGMPRHRAGAAFWEIGCAARCAP